MAQIALPRQQVTQTSESAAVGSPLYQRRGASTSGPIELIPNPHFVFPQRAPHSPPESNATTNPRPMSLQPLPSSRRGSAGGPRQKSVSALPDFSFNPAGSTEQATVGTSPPHTPTSTTPTTPSRNIGHRRGGSEFIGGDGRASGMNLLSSSPTKGEGVLPPPNATLRPGPPAGRRGHAHRRSGAISSHDLSSIINPSTNPNTTQRSGSAPVTPLENDMKPFFSHGHTVNKSLSQPSLHRPSMEDNGLFQDDNTRRPPSRARVGFSDKVEYIRPLSTISSETESSMSTVRGHSVNNSLSSVISNGTASPPSARMARPSLHTTFENESRPSTAGAILDGKQSSIGFGGSLFDRRRPMSAIAPSSPVSSGSPVTSTIPAKRKGFFHRRSDPSLPPVLLSTSSDPALSSSALESPLSSPGNEMTEDEAMDGCEKFKSARKGSLGPRKVKSWANSFISRKGKQHGNRIKNRPPTPPAPESPVGDEDEVDEMDFEANFDVDNTVTIVTPTADDAPNPKVETDYASWKPRELKRQNSDTMSPVIDLDAALGPFNTPSGSSPRSQNRGIAARRALHSAGGLHQNHRRTESAPELAPFEHRPTVLTSTSPMADVFEEDEEEDTEMTDKKSPVIAPASKEAKDEAEESSIGIQVVDADGAQNGSSINWNFDDGLRIKQNRRSRKAPSTEELAPLEVPTSLETLPVPTSRTASNQSIEVSSVEVVEDFEEPRTSSLTRSSDSTITPTMSPEEPTEPKELTLQLPLGQQSLMTPDTFTTSSFSSPDFRSSQQSFDTTRLGTAASSITDYRAMPSPQFGEPGPELRVSVDDVPSLTSSRSTMTSAMHNVYPAMSSRAPGDRSASLCSVPSVNEQHRRKRASIASLSRLIHGSSYGEKSKLSIEQRPQSECIEPAKDANKKKHKRLSKLMSFWKPKDSSRT